MELPFQKLDQNAVLPTRGHPGDAGLDLYSIEPAHLGPGERWSVGTGIAVEIPGHDRVLLHQAGDHEVTIHGAVGEVLLASYGRGRAAEIDVDGRPEDIARLSAAPLGL